MEVKFKDDLGHELDNIIFELKDTKRGYFGLYMSGYCKKCKRTFEIDMSICPVKISLDEIENKKEANVQ